MVEDIYIYIYIEREREREREREAHTNTIPSFHSVQLHLDQYGVAHLIAKWIYVTNVNGLIWLRSFYFSYMNGFPFNKRVTNNDEMLLYYLPHKLEIYGYSIVTEPPKYIIKSV